VFSLLRTVRRKHIASLLELLCEIPILPVCQLKYEIKLNTRTSNLHFNTLERANDNDVAVVALSLLNPVMIVSIWEALLVERKVLVLSSIHNVILPCCEFLRSIILPFPYVNTYVPVLPESLLSTIEAPFPYLVGAHKETLLKARVDTSDTVIVDLDLRTVVSRGNYNNTWSYSHISAPKFATSRLLSDISNLLVGPLASYIGRSFEFSGGRATETSYPLSVTALRQSCLRIQQTMIRANLSLISARTCDLIPFYRNPEGPLESPFSMNYFPPAKVME